MEHRTKLGNTELLLVVGDITEQSTDAIANAANRSLLGGGGVDGAIHRAAGPELLAACKELRKSLAEGLPTGQAVITPGFGLRARHVIHCVGPIYHHMPSQAPSLLANCYRNALRLCKEHGLRSVTFPSISTGAYGYPVKSAAKVALDAVAAELWQPASVELVCFALFDEETFEAYRRAAIRLSPQG